MDIIPFASSIRQHYRRKRGYNRLSSSPNRRSVKVVRFGTKYSWRRLRLAPRLRVAMRLSSPLKLWYKFKNAYMGMMLRLATTSGSYNSINVFGNKRIPNDAAAAAGDTKYSQSEFDNRLMFEIYKNMVASYELGYTTVNK